MKNTMNQKSKCNKLELIYKILIIVLMGLVDAGVVVFGRTSGLGFMETIGKKKLLLLLLAGVVLFGCRALADWPDPDKRTRPAAIRILLIRNRKDGKKRNHF